MALELYERVGDFSDDEVTNKGGRTSVDAAQLDAELDAIKLVLDDARAKLARIQRDDDALADDVLLGHEFSSSALSVLGAVLSTGSLVFRGEWAAATLYAERDVVSVTGYGAFICVIAHTSPGAFAASPNWQQLAADGAGAVPSGVVAVASDITLDASHNTKTLETSGTRVLTLPLAASMANGYSVRIAPVSGSVTINRSGTDTIDGATAVTLAFVATGTRILKLQVNAARDGWRIVGYKGAGTAGTVATWDGTQMGYLQPSAPFQALVADAASAATFQGNQLSASHTANFSVSTATGYGNVERVDATASDITVSLPAAVGVVAGFRTTIFKTDSTNNKVIIDGNGSETINGQLTVTLCIQYEFVTLVFDGGGWLIVEDGRKALIGTNTLNLAASSNGYFDIANPFGSDDVDFGCEAFGSLGLGSGGMNFIVVMTAPDKRMFTVIGSTIGTPFGSAPATGYLRITLINVNSAAQDVTVKYWIRRRGA